jgi:C4-dicarboxylate-specific signal transduction histidine kinase
MRALDNGLQVAASQELLRADLGELAGPLVHEFNNFLNCLVLHLALLDAQATPTQSGDLAEMRRQIAAVARLAKHFQDGRRMLVTPRETCKLDEVVQAAVAECVLDSCEEPPVVVRTVLDAGAEVAQASADDVSRICRFLVRSSLATAATVPAGEVIICTGKRDHRLFLGVRDNGPPLDDVEAQGLFCPGLAARPGALPLELAACQAIVQRSAGTLTAHPLPGGGMMVEAELKAATP